MRRICLVLLCVALASVGVAPAAAATVLPAAGLVRADLPGEVVASPDGSLEASVDVVGGRLTYQVERDGSTTVVEPSGLGFRLRQPQVDLTAGMRIESVERDEIDETWTPAWGTDASVRNHANELTVHAVHEASGIELDVVVRVFDDGVGVRYHFPDQDALGDQFVISAEGTQFSLPADMTAYYLASGLDNNADERHYQTVPVPQVPTAQTPITLERADGLFVTVHEADLTDYPSMTLVRDPAVPGRLTSELVALPNGDKAVIDLAADGFDTPWRTLTVGRDAGALAESHLIENLNDACAICDVDSDGDGVDDTTDWIQPATYTGVWWELQRRATTWNAGPNHGATTERTKDYIDLAADAGAKFVLAEGWNTNAGGSWTNQDFTTPQSDFDLDEVLSYAESKGVGFVAHNETRGYVDYYDANLERIFSTYEALGIQTIKTGYATRFLLGGVNRSHYDQEAVQHYQRVIDAAAAHGITINAHESIKPTGLARTYPNLMTGEAVAGMEQQNYKGANGNPPEQATILPFTRFMGGPADYTPGVLNVTWDPARLGTRVQTTVAAQLALYTTFFSPMNMLADTPENYAENAEAYAYLRDMPTTWDESEVDADIGDHVVTARRSGDTWYAGIVTDEVDRTLTVDLDFLDPGTTYVAEVWSDAAETTWKGNPLPVEVTESLVTSETAFVSSVVAGGGQAMRLRPATDDDLATLADYAAPAVEMTGDPQVSFDPTARTVAITASFTNTGSTVGPASVLLDGDPIGGAVRVPADGESTRTFTVPADSVPYPGPSELTVRDGSGTGSDTRTVSLLPSPTADDYATVRALIADGALGPDGATAEAYLRRLSNRVQTGSFLGAQRAVQGLRLLVESSAPDVVDAETAGVIDDLVTPYLGEPSGAFSVLRRLRELESSGVLSTEVAAGLRTQATSAARAAIVGEAAQARTVLTELRTALADSGVEPSTVVDLDALLGALVTEQRIETESGTLANGASLTTEHPGYTGTGFVKGLTRLGASVTVNASAPLAMDYDVAFRYANGMVVQPLDRTLSLSVGGDVARTVLFPNTGQDAERWRRWTMTAAYPVPLTAGANTIGLGWTGNDTGNVNVDHVVLRGALGVVDDPAVGDVAPPVIDVALSPTPDGPWSPEPVTVTVTSTDAATAVESTSIRIDQGEWVAYTGPVTISDEGRHTVRVRSQDTAGNTATVTRTVGVDTVAPRLRFGYREGPRTVRLIRSDATSKVASTTVRVSGGDWQPYTAPLQLPRDTAVVVEARVTDRAGHTTEASLRVSRSGDVVGPREPITARLVGRSGTAGRDVLTVRVPATAAGAVVQLHRVDAGGGLTPVRKGIVGARGTVILRVADPNGQRRTAYRARVAPTERTRFAWTPVVRVA